MIKSQLLTLAESDYQKFSSRLLPGTKNILGVRLPYLRKIAKQIAKQEGLSYFDHASDSSFEELMLQGMVIGYLQQYPIEEILSLIANFVPKIDNWSTCDSFCAGLKIAKQYKEEIWEFITPYLSSSKEFEVRFAIVMMLIYYKDDVYINRVLKSLDDIHHEAYYVQMAIAWAISACFVENQEITLAYLAQNNLDSFTYNKSLQKIIESSKVSPQMKQTIRGMRRIK